MVDWACLEVGSRRLVVVVRRIQLGDAGGNRVRHVVGLGEGHDRVVPDRMVVVGMGRGIRLGAGEKVRRMGFLVEELRSDLVEVEGSVPVEEGNGLAGEDSDPVAGHRIAVLDREAVDSLGEGLEEGPEEVLVAGIRRKEVLETGQWYVQ